MEISWELKRDQLIESMLLELPGIRASLELSESELADRIGMDALKYRDIERGKRKMLWSDYMSLLFLFWNNGASRVIVERKGLFPDELKELMSTNRNAHAPG